MVSHAHQEQIVAGETLQNIVIPTMQKQMIVQNIPEVRVVQEAPEHIVETTKVVPRELADERVQQRRRTACGRPRVSHAGTDAWRGRGSSSGSNFGADRRFSAPQIVEEFSVASGRGGRYSVAASLWKKEEKEE